MKKLSVFDLNKQLLFCLSTDPSFSQEKKELLRRIAGGEIYLESSRPEEEKEEPFFASGLSMALEVVSDWDKKSEVSFAGYLLDKRIREEAAKCIENFSFMNENKRQEVFRKEPMSLSDFSLFSIGKEYKKDSFSFTGSVLLPALFYEGGSGIFSDKENTSFEISWTARFYYDAFSESISLDGNFSYSKC